LPIQKNNTALDKLPVLLPILLHIINLFPVGYDYHAEFRNYCFWINLKMEAASYIETLVFAHVVMSQMTYYLQQATFI
jgi:hypothetical protein